MPITLSSQRGQPQPTCQATESSLCAQPSLGPGARLWGAGLVPAPGSGAPWLPPAARPFPTEREPWATRTPGHSPQRPARLLTRQRAGSGARARGHRPSIETYLQHICVEAFLPLPSALPLAPPPGGCPPPHPSQAALPTCPLT